MKKHYHVITERNDEYISAVAIAESVEPVKAHFAGQNVREIVELNAAQVSTISAAAATTIIDLTAEQPQTVTHDYTALADTLRAELNARHDRSTWNKAVTLYALDLLDDVQEGADNMERLPIDGAELERWGLADARAWELDNDSRYYNSEWLKARQAQLAKRHVKLDKKLKEYGLQIDSYGLYPCIREITKPGTDMNLLYWF